MYNQQQLEKLNNLSNERVLVCSNNPISLSLNNCQITYEKCLTPKSRKPFAMDKYICVWYGDDDYIYLPSMQEGFKQVIIINQHTYPITITKEEILKEIFNKGILDNNLDLPSYQRCIGYNQQNTHHHNTLDMHLHQVANYIQEHRDLNIYQNKLLYLAALLHDVGKPITATKTGKLTKNVGTLKQNDKVRLTFSDNILIATKNHRSEIIQKDDVIIDNNLHYYGHDYVGASIIFRELALAGFTEKELFYIYELIANHMLIPSDDIINRKTARKIATNKQNILDDLILLREADLQSSSDNIDIFTANVQKIKNS